MRMPCVVSSEDRFLYLAWKYELQELEAYHDSLSYDVPYYKPEVLVGIDVSNDGDDADEW